MAIDTTQKLVSALWKSLPFPDAVATDNGDLQHIAWVYAGVLANLPFPFAHTMHATATVLRSGHSTGSLMGRSTGTSTVLRRSVGIRDREGT